MRVERKPRVSRKQARFPATLVGALEVEGAGEQTSVSRKQTIASRNQLGVSMKHAIVSYAANCADERYERVQGEFCSGPGWCNRS